MFHVKHCENSTNKIDKIKQQTGKTEKGNYRYRWHQSLTPDIGREHLKKTDS